MTIVINKLFNFLNMKKISFLVINLICLIVVLNAQIAPNKYYIQFTDKNNSPYSINDPETFLTARAIARRQAQNIPIQENDIPVNPQYVQGVAATGAQILNTSRWLNGVTIFTDDSTVLTAIEALPYVDHLVKATGGRSNGKTYFENESFTTKNKNEIVSANRETDTYDYGFAYNQINQIKGIGLHDLGFRGQGMVIAVLDAGYGGVLNQPLFDSLRANNQILGTKDFVVPNGNVYFVHWHGRMVLSCMAANISGLMIGTAPKASYWLLRSEDGASENVIEEYNWVSAAEFADSVGADIINSSLGYINFDDSTFNHPYSDMDGNTCISTIGADIAASKGIIVTNSAGNSGNNSFFPWVGAPADGDSVFTIGAVDSTGVRSTFSSIGPTYDGRIKPTVMAQGQGVAIADGDTGVIYGDGTSFSSPIIAGMTACLWQAHPEMNNMDIIQALKGSASQSSFPDNYMGWGIPNYMFANSILTNIEMNKTGNNMAKAFPNPFRNVLQIEFKLNDSSVCKMKLFNAFGELVMSRSFLFTKFTAVVSLSKEISNLPAGIYFLKIVNEKKSETLKLIKE